MRVGIITYHHHYNYGTMLQALALQEAIIKLGYDAEIINFYQPTEKSRQELKAIHKDRFSFYLRHPKYVFNKVKDKVAYQIARENLEKKEKAFETFYQKNICLSEQKFNSANEIRENPPIYDIYVVGSDQTWNPNVGGNPDSFFLDFAPTSAKRISYAPSVSVPFLDEDSKNRFARLLDNIQVLSCRENDGALLLEKITGRNVATVLDPTFLLDEKDWSSYFSLAECPREYILQYLIGDRPEHRGYIKRLAHKNNLPIISIPSVPIDYADRFTTKAWCGPSEFLYLISNATLVCTDSFHGTAFSLNFRKNVFSFYKMDDKADDSENSRLRNIFAQFDINDRIITNFLYIPSGKELEISYNEDLLKRKINDSKNYLTKALKGET